MQRQPGPVLWVDTVACERRGRADLLRLLLIVCVGVSLRCRMCDDLNLVMGTSWHHADARSLCAVPAAREGAPDHGDCRGGLHRRLCVPCDAVPRPQRPPRRRPQIPPHDPARPVRSFASPCVCSPVCCSPVFCPPPPSFVFILFRFLRLVLHLVQKSIQKLCGEILTVLRAFSVQNGAASTRAGQHDLLTHTASSTIQRAAFCLNQCLSRSCAHWLCLRAGTWSMARRKDSWRRLALMPLISHAQ